MTQQKQIRALYCQLVAETFTYIEEHFESIVPAGCPDQEIYWKTKAVYEQLEQLLGQTDCRGETIILPAPEGSKEAAEGEQLIAAYLEYARNYFTERRPADHAENRRLCRNVVLNTVQMIANLAIWLECLYQDPAANYVQKCLVLAADWKVHFVHSGTELLLHGQSNTEKAATRFSTSAMS